MKQLFLSAILILSAIGCSDETTTIPFSPQRECASYEVLQAEIASDPKRGMRLEEIEANTQHIFMNGDKMRLLQDGTIEIPVWVNVLYRTNGENVSDAQITSQIKVLNDDFAGTNADYSSTPSPFQSVRSGDTKIKFVLAGVIRKSTKKVSWQTNNDMKRSSKGGIDATNCGGALNIWVCNLSNSILGYAQFPGGLCATDGVVIDNNAFGSGFSSNYSVYNGGRTATHEVGHYFNLRHIWGDASCGNDQVSDTPVHNSSNSGCPTYPHYSTCSGTPLEMTMNYMDYTNDNCMYMFTTGQSVRMKATFTTGGGREGLAIP